MSTEVLPLLKTRRVIGPTCEDDWQNWVSASATRNFILNDPLLDWLSRYGMENGFLRDDESAGYDPRTDFGQFIFQKGRQFEQSVVALLSKKYPVVPIGSG